MAGIKVFANGDDFVDKNSVGDLIMKYYIWLVMFFWAVGIGPGVVAGDVEDCEKYFFANDYTRAFSVCSHAAEQGNARAQLMLAVMYDNGEGVLEDNREAVRWYRLAAEQGNVIAQFNLGVTYDEGEGVLEDNREAIKWYRLAAEQGNAKAQFNLGAMYDNGEGVLENDHEAVKWYRLAAEQGNAKAQYNLGVMYDNGEGVLEDNREAVKWFRLAAEQGNVIAQYNLGVIYGNGYGVTQSYREAAKWFRLAAEQGYAKAQYNLGVMYVNGYGVIENDREAAKWYRLSAEQGYAGAQNNLGMMYDEGEGVLEDNHEAVKWYRLSAEQGYAEAQDNLGVMYYLGEGVIQDYQESYIWFLLAAVSGDKGAIERRDIAANRLTFSERRLAQKEAKRRQQEIESRQYAQPANDSPSTIAPRAAVAPDIAPNPAAVAFENGWRSVVVVETDESQGSGVIIRPNLVATNCHVIDDGTAIIVFKANARRAQKDEVFYAEIHRADEGRDLCLLSVSGLWGIPANVRRSDSLKVGEAVYAIGAPQGLDYSLSAGVISQLRQESENLPPIQTDAAISPGSSGGGLFDAQGNLVGITTSKHVGESVEGINFAIPADWILQAE